MTCSTSQFAPAQIAAAILLWRALAPSVTLAVLAALLSLGNGFMAIRTVRMLMGIDTLEDALVAGIPTVALMFGFLLAVGLIGAGRRRLGRASARWAAAIGAVGVGGMLLFTIGFLLPPGSPAQWTVFVVGGAPAVLAYAVYPVWWLVLGARR